MDMDRREMMKLAVLFAAATWLERGHAMDNPGAMPRAAAGKDDPQNAYAVGGTSNFKAVYGDGTHSAPLAKYADSRRALDAADLANYLAREKSPVEAN